MAAQGAWAPENGGIPLYRKGGKTDGGLIGYASVLPAPDGGGARVLLHGRVPHLAPVSGCAACVELRTLGEW